MTKEKHSTKSAPKGSISPEEALFRIVFNEYEQAHAQFDANWAAYCAAEKLVEESEAFRRKTELANTYGLRSNMSGGEAIEALDRGIEARDFPNGTPGDLTDEICDAMADEAQRLWGEYRGLLHVITVLREQHRVGELHSAHCRFLSEVFNPARTKLMNTPAPTIEAALTKADILGSMYDDAEGLCADLHRLFASK